jgi:hypothetical protein
MRLDPFSREADSQIPRLTPLNLGKRKMLDTLVFDSRSLERLCRAAETLRLEIPFLNERLKAFSSEVRLQEK